MKVSTQCQVCCDNAHREMIITNLPVVFLQGTLHDYKDYRQQSDKHYLIPWSRLHVDTYGVGVLCTSIPDIIFRLCCS